MADTVTTSNLARQRSALLRVLQLAAARGYHFRAVTPQTHQRYVSSRGERPATTLRDIFGWSLPFLEDSIERELVQAMHDANVLKPRGEAVSSGVRIADVDDDLFLHSAYPTNTASAVFFGPDTYRFIRFIRHEFERQNPEPDARTTGRALRILDVGCGSGAGGILAARTLAQAGHSIALTLNDINPMALQYAGINAEFAGVPTQLMCGDFFSSISGQFDLIISNPPYLVDPAARTYRHGGERLGRALSVDIVKRSLQLLAPDGMLLLYTGVAIVDGIDPFQAEILALLSESDCRHTYSEIDPDIFGDELEQPAYAHVERIAAVGLSVRRNDPR